MKYLVITLVLVISTTNCTDVDKVQDEGNTPSFYKAIAVINPINDSNVSGIAYFQQTENGVHVKVERHGPPERSMVFTSIHSEIVLD